MSFILVAICSPVAFANTNIKKLIASLNTASDSNKCNIYYSIYKYYAFYNPDSAYFYLEDGIKNFSSRAYQPGIAMLTNLLGTLDANHGNLLIARKRQLEALQLYKELNKKKGIGLVYNSLGTIDGRQGNWDSATFHFIQAQKVFLEIGYEEGLYDTYTNLGQVNQNTHDFLKALAYYDQALNIAEKDSTGIGAICNAYNNIAIMYGELGELSKSVDYLQRALKRSNKEQYIDVYMYSLLNLGIVYSKFGDQARALASLNEALSIAREKKMPQEHANILLNIASITGKTNAPEAIKQLEEAEQIARSVGDKDLLKDIYSDLADLNKKIGNYKAVVGLMEQIKKYEDSTASVAKVKEIANLQSVYELEQSAAKIKELKFTEQAGMLKRNILLTVVAGLAILVAFILFYLRKMNRVNIKLAHQEQLLKASNHIKDRLFSIIGHDLRSPIGNITMILDLLEKNSGNADDEFILHSLKDQATYSLDTLDKLLYWGKAQISGAQLKLENIDVTDHLVKNIGLLQMNADQKKIRIVNEVPANLSVHADPAHFDFLVRNLLSNAVKFTNTGGQITISADNSKVPGYTTFAVADNGIGLDADRLPKLFDAFQNNSSGTANEKGTGIGLMLCKEFIVEQEGKIWAESSIGIGTTIFFSLPCTRL